MDERINVSNVLPLCPICRKIIPVFIIDEYNVHINKCYKRKKRLFKQTYSYIYRDDIDN